MKAEFDKEIDAMLREGARRGLAAPSEHGARAEGGVRATPAAAHLDADEQNAYAENSLPAAARTHYAAHLADCDDCRRSVTRLARAAGMAMQLEQSAAVSAQGVLANDTLANVASANAASSSVASPNAASSNATWRERLGALLAPRAWRYAVPALALLLVGAVALMVSIRAWRSDLPNAADVSVAQQRSKSVETKTAPPELNHAPQNGNTAAPGVMSAEEGAQPAQEPGAPATREESAAVRREDQGQPKTSAPLSDNESAPPPPPATGAASVSVPAPVSAAEMPAPTPTPLPELVVANALEAEQRKAAERREELAKDAQRTGGYETRQQRDREGLSGPRRNSDRSRNIQRGRNDEPARDEADKNEATAASSAPAPTAAQRRAKPREAQRETGAQSSGDSVQEGMRVPKPAETRTVAGRKFRRAGGAWVDTAYNSSQAVTSVRRNSEQYRALVADEPALRRISDALGGEVTVVWKGRAYRIR